MIEDNRERDGVESKRQSERLWGLSWTFLLGEKKKEKKTATSSATGSHGLKS